MSTSEPSLRAEGGELTEYCRPKEVGRLQRARRDLVEEFRFGGDVDGVLREVLASGFASHSDLKI